MTYNIFKETILHRLDDDIPNPKKITVESVCRNNGDCLDGLVILENGVNIGPTLYLNYYYKSYRKGTSFQKTYEQILEHYEANKTTKSVDVSFFTDFDRTGSRIAPKLIHFEKNRKLLQDIPHIPFLDLAIVFYCYIPMEPEIGNATILIRNSHLEFWEQTEDALYPLARKNAARLLPPKLHNMNSLIEEMMPEQSYPTVMIPDDPLYPMYVLTNSQNLFGASCLLYDDLIHSLADRFQSDFYILPSSIHEIILIPASCDSRLNEFSDMVREVNETQVADEEILSDHAYYYSRERDRITFTD
ncbi:MAG: DUF5688 family protein [Lachnospiraceae bacterium]|nr:DUF5688 family protein [Lachnospiraceae bacterium]